MNTLLVNLEASMYLKKDGYLQQRFLGTLNIIMSNTETLLVFHIFVYK